MEVHKMSPIDRIENYLSLIKQYPNVFVNTSGELEIIVDKKIYIFYFKTMIK